MADIGIGSMAWINLIAILFLSRQAFIILKDYEKQIQTSQELSFDPSIIGVEDKAGVWRKRGGSVSSAEGKSGASLSTGMAEPSVEA